MRDTITTVEYVMYKCNSTRVKHDTTIIPLFLLKEFSLDELGNQSPVLAVHLIKTLAHVFSGRYVRGITRNLAKRDDPFHKNALCLLQEVFIHVLHHVRDPVMFFSYLHNLPLIIVKQRV